MTELAGLTIVELVSGVVALGAFFGVLAALWKGFVGIIHGAVKDSATIILADFALKFQALNMELADVKHKGNNTAQRTDALERAGNANVERIVKLETNLTNLEKGQERIEHHLEGMKADTQKARAEIIESLREIRQQVKD